MQLPIRLNVEPPTLADLRAAARGPWLYLAAGVLIAGAASAAALHEHWWGDGADAPDAATVRIESPTPGAEVEVNGRARGHAPVDLRLRPGAHTVRVHRSGHAEVVRRVEVGPHQAVRVRAEPWLTSPEVRRLRPAFPGAVVASAGFLADGRVALTIALPADEERQLWLLEDGGERRFGPPRAQTAIAASPDGGRFAYLARGDQAPAAAVGARLSEVWVGARDGDAGRRAYALPAGRADERLVDVAWAPDGVHLLVAARQLMPTGGGRTRLLWVDPAGGAQEIAQLPSEVVPGSYAWSPDGRSVAFLARAGQLTSLCLVGTDGTGFRNLVDLTRDDPAPLPFVPLAWPGDADRLVFAAPVDDRSSSLGWLFGPKVGVGLFAAHPAEPTVSRLGESAGQSPAWRRDGTLVALARPKADGPLAVLSYAPDGRPEAVAELPLKPAAVYGARWDTAHAQAIVALRGSAGFGASRPDYWLVRFAEAVR